MRLLFADKENCFFDHPEFAPVGRTGDSFVELVREDFIELPSGSTLVSIPEGDAIGIFTDSTFKKVKNPARGQAMAVGAILPQGYTRTFWPAYKRKDNSKILPLMGYAAAAWHKGKILVAAIKTDQPKKWDPAEYNSKKLPLLVNNFIESMPDNRIIRHLAKCALEYSCFTAQNIFYSRWEGGIPASPVCNARCLGCISLQPAECCPSPQSRIDFKPTAQEIFQIGYNHLAIAEDGIISFGQGCEGEPSLAADVIGEAIEKIRSKTDKGTININTNGGDSEKLEYLCRTGLDSIRVSLISAREEVYNAYYQPQGYRLENVRASIKKANELGIYCSLNLLTSPGLNDREEEAEALLEFIRETGIKLVQLRNLNIDPDYFFNNMPRAKGQIIGIAEFINKLKGLSNLDIGSFSRSIR
ncbi:MAG: radical SAM protein [Peptococcaceae bacterium]|nr:radical SAM protein [Peptococcaceae bacterium]